MISRNGFASPRATAALACLMSRCEILARSAPLGPLHLPGVLRVPDVLDDEEEDAPLGADTELTGDALGAEGADGADGADGAEGAEGADGADACAALK